MLLQTPKLSLSGGRLPWAALDVACCGAAPARRVSPGRACGSRYLLTCAPTPK
ncbi:hypothetical protein X961_5463 [Burkholderia pseudomallei MSHR5613]|nr:hypothetical protein X961_5463 [Burkholderia pseudomallei MSHR5613]KGX51090.1 hypothetical protein Y025_5262 [Burkholderia pseudomallei TSV32]